MGKVWVEIHLCPTALNLMKLAIVCTSAMLDLMRTRRERQ